MNNLELVPCANAGELARAAASAWLDEIEAANRAVKPYFAALSGGRIAPAFFASTVGQARARAVRFDRVHFFWADERCVPRGDAESNFRVARELLLAPLGIPESQIHRVRGEDPPEIAAAGAEAEIRRIVPLNDARQPVLDLVLLGLGEDGHVASLFPGEPEEWMSSRAVYRAITNSPKPPPDRVTLGYAAIAAAQQGWVLVSGAGKEKALRDSVAGSGKTPFARVLKLRDRTKIFTDITRL